MAVAFGTKAETLARLSPQVRTAHILPQVTVEWDAWRRAPEQLTALVQRYDWLSRPVIVRSSCRLEDAPNNSYAGHFLSVANACGTIECAEAVWRVFRSYGYGIRSDDQVLIQPFINDAILSGVAFTRDPNSGAPYRVINYSGSGETNAVTGGVAAGLQTYYVSKSSPIPAPQPLSGVMELLAELELLLGTDAVDVEFAISASMGLCLLQARPLNIQAVSINLKQHANILDRIAKCVENRAAPHPSLHGRKSIFGVMPDWNPAEIIGIRPRPLALSLYRSLVTDQIWAYQRSSYGYKNLRSFPLVVSFGGLPYVDVRVSFNSFVPDDIAPALADQLVDYYTARLEQSPALHDKVEFEIVFSCYALDTKDRLAALESSGFSASALDVFAGSLRRLTNRIMHSDTGLWRADLRRIRELDIRRRGILDSNLDHISKIYWLLEDCKRWGTLPFAGLARAAFIAMQMLRSMVTQGVIDSQQFEDYLANLDTITTRMVRDMSNLDRPQFLEKYGHLRPGTYDILSARYDEAPDLYLGERSQVQSSASRTPFKLMASQERLLSDLLAKHGLDTEVEEIFDFIRLSIQGREQAKFLFTRSLSDALLLMRELGEQNGLSAEDMSFSDISTVEELYVSTDEPREALQRSIKLGRARYQESCQTILPPLINSQSDVWSFHIPSSEPNYVTQRSAEGRVYCYDGPQDGLEGSIVLISSADPGFDWIFSRGIAGLITAYGGVNSHMAIRAGECGLPAVIGAGEILFQQWAKAKRLRIDCANRKVDVLQ